MTVEVKFVRLPHARELPDPERATAQSAGWDLCAAIEGEMTLASFERAFVPTGLEIAVPPGFEAQVRPRSGRALREGLGLVNSPGTIDSDYRGEVGVLVINFGEQPLTIRRGDRIAQLVIVPIPAVRWTETTSLEATSRARGGFGSTGR
jgi:dUTP pyrophosphatase